MEATKSLTSSSRKRRHLPAFYEPSNSATHAAKIIAEARQSLRVLHSDRPCTPAEHNRKLFGKNKTSNRPPSVYSIGARHFTDSRPPTAQRLDPLEPSTAILNERLKPTPPTSVQSTCDLIPQSHSHTSDLIPQAHSHTTSETETVCASQDNGVDRRSSVPNKLTGVIPHPPPIPQGEVAGGGRRIKKNKSDPPPQFWQTEITPLLSQLSSSSSQSDQTTTDMIEVVDKLHQRLMEQQCYGRTGGVAGVKQRSSVLRVVFSLLDSSNASLLIKLATIIITMEVTGRNLLNVCKLLFSLARTDTNDQYFITEKIAGPLLGILTRCDVWSETDVLVYGVGTVKLLASNPLLCQQLIDNEALSFLQSILYCYNHQTSDDTAQINNIQNVLIQLTAALRNLLEHGPLHSSLISSNLLPQLAETLSLHTHHSDITFNITRILSKLTLDKDCCVAIINCPSFLPLLLQCLTIHNTHPDILVRVCFILGNLTTDDNNVRNELYTTHHILSPLTILTSSCLATELTKETCAETTHERGSNEELLIKLIRLLANMSVDSVVGSEVASDKDIVDEMMTILSSLQLGKYHELTVNTLATLNNLSYHATNDSYLLNCHQQLSELMLKVLLEDDGEPLLECVRCYGNLSRHKTFRQTISKAKVDELMVTLLDSSRYELVYASCGVLVNLMIDPIHRTVLQSTGGVMKLLDVLCDFGSNDWQLASLVCQILWNFSDGLTSSVACFGEAEVEKLIQLLLSHTELPETMEDEWRDYFLPVGINLLERVSSHHNLLNTSSTNS